MEWQEGIPTPHTGSGWGSAPKGTVTPLGFDFISVTQSLCLLRFGPTVVRPKMITTGLFKGLYKHHTDESVVSRSIICHPPEHAQGNIPPPPPLEPSSQDHPVLQVQTHSSEISRMPFRRPTVFSS